MCILRVEGILRVAPFSGNKSYLVGIHIIYTRFSISILFSLKTTDKLQKNIGEIVDTYDSFQTEFRFCFCYISKNDILKRSKLFIYSQQIMFFFQTIGNLILKLKFIAYKDKNRLHLNVIKLSISIFVYDVIITKTQNSYCII